MINAPAIGLKKQTEADGALCAADFLGAHHHAHHPASYRWARRAGFLPANPPLSTPSFTRPHATNEVLIAWGRVKAACGGLAIDLVGMALGRDGYSWCGEAP